MKDKVDKKTVKKLLKPILKMVKDILGFEYRSFQKKFARRFFWHLLRGNIRRLSLFIARQGGKGDIVAVCLLVSAAMMPYLAEKKSLENTHLRRFKDGISIGIFTPSYRQSGILFNKIRKRIRLNKATNKLPLAAKIISEIGVNVTKCSGLYAESPKSGYPPLIFPNNSNIDVFTTEQKNFQESKLEGYSYHIIVLDEDQSIEDTIYKKSIVPTGSSSRPLYIHSGTKGAEYNHFDRVMALNKEKRPKDHFEMDYKDVANEVPEYEEFIDEMIDVYGGEKSAEFQMAYALNRVANSKKFCSRARYAKMGYDFTGKRYDFVKYTDDVVCAGIDVGTSFDSTVVSVGKIVKLNDFGVGVKILNLQEFIGNIVEQYPNIYEVLTNYRNLKTVVVDNVGLGRGVHDYLALKPEVEAYEWDLIPCDYSAEEQKTIYEEFDNHMKSNTLKVPAKGEASNLFLGMLQSQFTMLERIFVDHSGGGKRIKIINPNKKRGRRKNLSTDRDDFPASIALCIYGLTFLTDYTFNTNYIDNTKIIDLYSDSEKSFINRDEDFNVFTRIKEASG
jgi:hypothetical protein